jgi:ABC-type multidrug transport system fused ATPase/permease subunit
LGEVLTYLMYMQRLTMNIGAMLDNIANLAKIQGSCIAIANIIYAPCDVNPIGKEQPRNIVGGGSAQIEINNASFAYPTKREVPILHDVSLQVPKNNIVALVGASGCGKSSIISLIERWYDPLLGKFSYNGVDLQDGDNKWYHQTQVAIVQ